MIVEKNGVRYDLFDQCHIAAFLGCGWEVNNPPAQVQEGGQAKRSKGAMQGADEEKGDKEKVKAKGKAKGKDGAAN